jgi:hypothetical protein
MGLCNLVLEHTSPEDWKKTAECTADEGSCFACDQGWRQKQVFYANVLVDDGKSDPYVAVWSRGLGKQSVAAGLYAMAGDDDYDLSITDKTFKFKRTGTTKDDTTYTLTPLPKPHDKNVEDFADELFDLDGVPFHVNPERQEKYYTGMDASTSRPAASSAPVNPTSPSAIDNEW